MKKPCNHPGCRNLIEAGRYCETHASKGNQPGKDYDQTRRKTDPALAAAKRLRSSPAWQRLRRIKLMSHPLCEDPSGYHERRGKTATANQVHHIRGLATNPELGLALDNLMSVCTRCHAAIERVVRADA